MNGAPFWAPKHGGSGNCRFAARDVRVQGHKISGCFCFRPMS